MTYKIKNFEEQFIESQAKLGSEVSKNWIGYTQSNAEQLKQTYSQEEFDPSTRLYAFKNDDLVGFVTSSVSTTDEGEKRASLRFPLVHPDHKQASYELLESCLEVLKSKDVRQITTSVKDDWGNFKELADRYGFELDRETSHAAIIPVDALKIESEGPDFTIEEVDTEADADALLDIFENSFGMTPEQAKNNLEAIQGFDESLIIGHPVIKKEDKIIARAWCQQVQNDNEIAFLGHIFAPEGEFEPYANALLSYLMPRIKDRGLEYVQKSINPEDPSKKKYEGLGFEFTHVYKNYKMEL